MQLFKTLSAQEETQYRNWARANYRPLEDIPGVWHPVVQDECQRINREFGEYVDREVNAPEKEGIYPL